MPTFKRANESITFLFVGKVPILDTGDKIITESLVISDYLDDQYPEHPLYPTEQALKQKDKELIASFDNITGHFVKAVFNTDNKPLSELVEGVKPEIERLEKELEQRGSMTSIRIFQQVSTDCYFSILWRY